MWSEERVLVSPWNYHNHRSSSSQISSLSFASCLSLALLHLLFQDISDLHLPPKARTCYLEFHISEKKQYIHLNSPSLLSTELFWDSLSRCEEADHSLPCCVDKQLSHSPLHQQFGGPFSCHQQNSFGGSYASFYGDTACVFLRKLFRRSIDRCKASICLTFYEAAKLFSSGWETALVKVLAVQSRGRIWIFSTNRSQVWWWCL